MRQNYDTSSPNAMQVGTIGHVTVAPPAKGRTSTTVRMSDANAWPVGLTGASASPVSLTAVRPLVPSRKSRAYASSTERPVPDLRPDQYFTKPELARRLSGVFRKHLDPHAFQMVKPSAGAGAFSSQLPPGSIAFDVTPMAQGIQKADFLNVNIEARSSRRDDRQSALRQERQPSGPLL